MQHTPPKTISISITVAANALQQFLVSGTLPAECTSVFATINSELKHHCSSQSYPAFAADLLTSQLIEVSARSWNCCDLPQNLTEEILDFFFFVAQTVLECPGEFTKGLGFRKSHTNVILNGFFHTLYKAALASEEPQLCKAENWRISEVFVRTIVAYPSVAASYVDHHQDLAPYLFFLNHLPLFHIHVSNCILVAQASVDYGVQLQKSNDVLRSKLVWGDVVDIGDPSNCWKIAFFRKLWGQNIADQLVLQTLALFLRLVGPWATLLEITLHFLNIGEPQESVESLLIDSVDSRLSLITKGFMQPSLSDYDHIIIWDFLNSCLDCKSVNITKALFYRERLVIDTPSSSSFKLRLQVCVGYKEAFRTAFLEQFPTCLLLVKQSLGESVAFTDQTSLALFLLQSIYSFFSNSLKVNRLLRDAVLSLTAFDCFYSSTLPYPLLEAFEETLRRSQEVPSVPTTVKPNVNTHNATEKPLIVPESFSKDEISAFQAEGRKQHLEILETMLGAVYAAVKSKEISRDVGVVPRQAESRE